MKNDIELILDTVTEFFIGFMIILFPLVIGPMGYRNVLEIKYVIYLFIASIYILSIIFILLYYLVFRRYNYFKEIHLKKWHYGVFIFVLVNIISYLFSPFKQYDLFLGLGRGEGLINLCLYTMTFTFISLFARFNKRYFMYIGISTILVSLIAIIQYLGFNIFHIYENGSGTYNMSFMTTIGNKDFLSAYYVLFLTILFGVFIFSKNKLYENIIYIISLFMGIFIFGIINVDSGLVAFVFTTMIMIPFIITRSEYLSKLMIVGSIVLSSYALNYILNPVYRYSTGIYKLECQFNITMLIMLVLSIIFIFVYKYIKNNKFEIENKKKIYKIYFISIPVFIILVLGIIYVYDFNIAILSDVQNILHGNLLDELGTYRMFLWKRSFNLIKDYPLIGSGPDTFAYRFMSKYLIDIIELDGRITINDTAGNVYLTMLVNIGIVGLLSYLNILISLLKGLIKKVKSNAFYFIMIFGLIAFAFQDLFNLNVVVITPIWYTCLAIFSNSIDFNKCK